MNNKQVRNAFDKDIEEIAGKLVKAFGLMHAQTSSTSLDEPLLRWLDFRFRYIEEKPRLIERSNQFPVQLPASVQAALSSMEQRILMGEDLNPYQSKTISKNDTSGIKRQLRTDGLWADWGIHHLHLAEAPAAPSERFSLRSGWLLFAMIYEDVIALIDVRDHNEASIWTQEDLVRTFIDSWPSQAERYKLDGAAASHARSAGEIAAFRKAGVNRFVTHKGASYLGMGQGLTSASTPAKVTLSSDKIHRNARALADWVADPLGKIMTDLTTAGIEQPKLSLSVHPQGLIIFEEASQAAWLMDRGVDTAAGALHQDLLPAWALGPLVQYWGANP